MNKVLFATLGVVMSVSVACAPLLASAMTEMTSELMSTSMSSSSMTPTSMENMESGCSVTTILAVGSRGDEVSCLQNALKSGGFLNSSVPSGYYGSITKAAVINWQKSLHIAATGVFGALSIAAFANQNKGVTATSAHPYYQQLEDSHKAMMAAFMSTSTPMTMDMPDNRKVIAVVLYNEFEPLDAIGPLEVLGQLYKDYKVVTVAKQKGEVASAFGTKIVADYSFDELKHPAIIVVPGGLFGTIAASKDSATLAWLREADKTSEYTTSVCTGAWILAAAGLLNGREASTHWTGAQYLEDFGVKYTGKRYTVDGKYVTAAGVSAGIDMGFKLIAMIGGDDAAKVAQLGLEYDPQPPFDAGSPAKADPVLVKIMRDQMKDHLMVAQMMYGTSSMAMQSGGMGAMEMSPYEIPANTLVPTISITAVPDPMGGYNVHLNTANFTFTPQKSGQANVSGEGHAHVLVDGVKVGRAYGEWFYVGQQPTGTHTIAVELETNDHRDYVMNGKQIEASIDVTSK